MAIIKCPECGKEISDKATNCINCGYPLNLLEKENTDNCDIILNSDANKIQVIKILMELKNISLADAKNIIDNTPQVIFSGVTLNASESILNKLKSVGADATVKMKSEINDIVNSVSSPITKEIVTPDLNVKSESTPKPLNTAIAEEKKKNMGCGIAVAIVIVIVFLVSLIGGSTDHDDGKCDICGDSNAIQVSSDAELCLEHIVWANDQYYKDNDNYGGF